MKKLIKICIYFCFFILFFLFSGICLAENIKNNCNCLSNKLLKNIGILKFINKKPKFNDFKFLSSVYKNSEDYNKALIALIYYKYYGNRYLFLLKKFFCLNIKAVSYKRSKRKLITFNQLDGLLKSLKSKIGTSNILSKLKLFFYFKTNNLWVISKYGEKLSLADFYRVNIFYNVLGANFNVNYLLKNIDSVNRINKY